MIKLFRWLRWKMQGSPTITYSGYNCGCCGRWVNRPFAIRKIDSSGSWQHDTWGVCPTGYGCQRRQDGE